MATSGPAVMAVELFTTSGRVGTAGGPGLRLLLGRSLGATLRRLFPFDPSGAAEAWRCLRLGRIIDLTLVSSRLVRRPPLPVLGKVRCAGGVFRIRTRHDILSTHFYCGFNLILCTAFGSEKKEPSLSG